MSNKLAFRGLARWAIILISSLSASCGAVQLQQKAITDSEINQKGYGKLSLASDSFPEGAETLILTIDQVGGPSPCEIGFPPEGGGGGGVEGLGLHANTQQVDCLPVVYQDGQGGVSEEFIGPDNQLIEVKRGEELKPISLRAGNYSVRADFLDASIHLLYTGIEWFPIKDGDSTSVIIHLKKVESGNVTIGFEVDKPEVLPTKIPEDASLSLRKSSKMGGKNIELDLMSGDAVLIADCASGGFCATHLKTIRLKKQDLQNIRAILATVKLQKIEGLCQDPIEVISLELRKCKECEAKKTFKFSNEGCGQPSHTLTSQQFEKIWLIVMNSVGAR